MELFVGSGAFRLEDASQTSLDSALSPGTAESLRKWLAGSQVTLEAFLADPSALLFVRDGAHLAAWVRDLCGKRLMLLGSDLDGGALLRSDLLLLAETVARLRGCHLLQWAIPRAVFEARSWEVPPGYYCTNLAFETSLAAEIQEDRRFSPVSFEDARFRSAAADFEYWVRWTYPGSTYGPLDLVSEVRAEYDFYPILQSKGAAAGVWQTSNPTAAYVIWVQNAALKSALIAMIWVDPSKSDEVGGDEVLKQGLRALRASGYEQARYLVAAQNIPAMKMLRRAGFSFTRYVLNKNL